MVTHTLRKKKETNECVKTVNNIINFKFYQEEFNYQTEIMFEKLLKTIFDQFNQNEMRGCLVRKSKFIL